MPRTKKSPAPDNGLDQAPINIPTVEAEASMRAVHAALTQHSKTLMETGHLQTHLAYAKISRLAAVQTFARLQESGDYKGLPYVDEQGNQLTVSTIQEFCTHYIGMSYQVLKEEADRLSLLGEDAYVSAKELGIKRDELRLLSKLPDDDQELVRSALEAKDKDSVLDVLERYVSKSAQEREKLQTQVQDLTEQQAANETLLAKKDEKINDLDRRLSRQRPADEVSDELAKQITADTQLTLGNLLALEQTIGQVTQREETPADLLDACAQAIGRIQMRLDEIVGNYSLTAIGPADDSWMDEARKTEQKI